MSPPSLNIFTLVVIYMINILEYYHCKQQQLSVDSAVLKRFVFCHFYLCLFRNDMFLKCFDFHLLFLENCLYYDEHDVEV